MRSSVIVPRIRGPCVPVDAGRTRVLPIVHRHTLSAGPGTKSTGIKSTRERNQPRNEVNPGIKSTQEENQPEHEINQGGKEINHKKCIFFKNISHFTNFFRYFSVI